METDIDRALPIVVQAAATLLASGRVGDTADATKVAMALVASCRRALEVEKAQLEEHQIITRKRSESINQLLEELRVYGVAHEEEDIEAFTNRCYLPGSTEQTLLDWQACVRFITLTKQKDQTKRAIEKFSGMLAWKFESIHARLPTKDEATEMLLPFEKGVTQSALGLQRLLYNGYQSSLRTRRARANALKKARKAKKVIDPVRDDSSGKFRRDRRKTRRAGVDDPTRRPPLTTRS